MRKYEIMLAVRGSLTEKEAESRYNKFVKHIEDNKGKIDYEEKWGKITTAYKIKHETEAYYQVSTFLYDENKIKDLEEFLEIENDLIRYLITKIEEEEYEPFTKEMYETGLKNYYDSRIERKKKSMPKTRATTSAQLEEDMEKIKQTKTLSDKSVSKEKLDEILNEDLSL